jgi:hypothetical protein
MALAASTINLSSAVHADEAKVGAVPGLAAKVAQQQPPKVELPKLPADGSGVYRLSLNGAIGAAPLVVLLEVKGAQVVRAVALPIHSTRVPWPADAGKLVVKDGRITGTLTATVMTECNLHKDRFTRADLPKAATCELKTVMTGTIVLDVVYQGMQGTGTYNATWSKGVFPFNATAKAVEKGVVTALREAPRPLPERCDVELQMYAGMADVTKGPSTVVRATLTKGGMTDLRAYVMEDGEFGKPLKVTQSELTLRDDRLTGRIQGEEGRPFALEISGEAIGRQLFGTVTCVDGTSRVTTAWLGQLYDVNAWRLPLDHTRNGWTW